MGDELIKPTLSYTWPIKGKTITADAPTLTVKDVSLPTSYQFDLIAQSGYATGKSVPEIQMGNTYVAQFKVTYPPPAMLTALSQGKVGINIALNQGSSSSGCTISTLVETDRVVNNGVVETLTLSANLSVVQTGAHIRFRLVESTVNDYYITPLYYPVIFNTDFVLRNGAKFRLDLIGGGGAGGNSSWSTDAVGNGANGSSPRVSFFKRPNSFSDSNYLITSALVPGGNGGTGGSWGNGSSFSNGDAGPQTELPSFNIDDMWANFDWTGTQYSGTWSSLVGQGAQSDQDRWGTQKGAVNGLRPEYGFGGNGAVGIGDERWAYGGAGGAAARLILDMMYKGSEHYAGMMSLNPLINGGGVSNNGSNKGTAGGKGWCNLTITDELGTRTYLVT